MHPQPIRVIVTGSDEDGRSFVASDGAATGTVVQPRRPVALTDLWHMSAVPTDTDSDGTNPEGRPFTLAPQPDGLVFRVVQFDPLTRADHGAVDSREVFASMNAESAHIDTTISPYMHRTATVDFGLVLRGTITMLLDDDVVDVSAGDVVIQRGTSHAWENRTDEPAIVAFVLVDGRATA